MIWILTAIGGLLWALLFKFIHILYGEALMRLSQTANKRVKSIGVFIVHLLLMCLGIGPLIIIAACFHGYYDSTELLDFAYIIYFLLCYAVALIYGQHIFNKRYVGKLIKLGFYDRKR